MNNNTLSGALRCAALGGAACGSCGRRWAAPHGGAAGGAGPLRRGASWPGWAAVLGDDAGLAGSVNAARQRPGSCPGCIARRPRRACRSPCSLQARCPPAGATPWRSASYLGCGSRRMTSRGPSLRAGQVRRGTGTLRGGWGGGWGGRPRSPARERPKHACHCLPCLGLADPGAFIQLSVL